MSIMKFLFLGMRKKAMRYRFTDQNYLPEFASTDPGISNSPTIPSPQASSLSSADLLKASPEVEQRPPKETKAKAIQKKVNRLAPKESGFRNPFSRRPKLTRRMIQGELLLENVQVMRNDLNESDLEVVPAKEKKPTAQRRKRKVRQTAASITGPAVNRFGELFREQES
jgi:hypothetical protein